MEAADVGMGIDFTRAGPAGRPLVVLMSGAPGSGKTTLAGHLGDIMRMPVISKDRLRQGTLWTLGTDDIDRAPLGPPLFYAAVERLLELGISVIADMTLYRGSSEPDIASRLAPRADLVNVHCCSPDAVERFERRTRLDPIHRHRVDGLLPEVRRLQEEGFEPLDLGCAAVIVDTTDGYQPGLAQIVDAVIGHRTSRP